MIGALPLGTNYFNLADAIKVDSGLSHDVADVPLLHGLLVVVVSKGIDLVVQGVIDLVEGGVDLSLDAGGEGLGGVVQDCILEVLENDLDFIEHFDVEQL